MFDFFQTWEEVLFGYEANADYQCGFLCMNRNDEAKIFELADQYLAPYRIKEKADGREIVPQLCPFCHGGDHADQQTFALSIEKGCYVCKRGSCGVQGSIEELARYFGASSSHLRGGKMIKTTKVQRFDLSKVEIKPPTEEIYTYFEKRKISRETVDAFKVGSNDKGMIVFPFYEKGVNTFVKFRRPRKPTEEEAKKSKEWREPNTKAILFHMDDCIFSEPLFITEGELDAMSLYEAGITNVTSVPSGCDDLSWIENCFDWLEKFKTIIIFGDNDAPGQKMVQDVCKRLDESRCMIVTDYPEKPDGGTCKDANEILYYCGAFELADIANSAESIPLKGILDLGEVEPVDETTIPRIKTMIPMLDEVIGGLIPGGVTIFTGKAGDGKSTLCGQLLLNGVEQSKSVCAYSGELRKERFQAWINLQAAGSDWITLKYDPVKGKQVPFVPWDVQRRIMDWYRGKFFLFDNNEIFESNQAESIIEVFTMAVRRYGCELFLVDNMMTSLSDVQEETRAQGQFINALKKFATRYNVHVLIVAHPRKTKIGEKLQKDDVGGNSQIVNLADTAIVVERPDLRIIKNRDGGRLCQIECCYCADSRRIYQANVGDLSVYSWDKKGLKQPPVHANSLEEYGIKQAEPQSPF